MLLKEYLDIQNITQAKFGSLIGVSHVIVHRLVHRKITPSLKLAAKIKRTTQGQVSFEDLIRNENENP
jgi:DNA-binding XRE family transcriptional regulator